MRTLPGCGVPPYAGLRVGQGNAKNRRKHMRFMQAFAMWRIQHVIFEFDTKIGSFAVGKLHASNFAAFAARSKVKT